MFNKLLWRVYYQNTSIEGAKTNFTMSIKLKASDLVNTNHFTPHNKEDSRGHATYGFTTIKRLKETVAAYFKSMRRINK